MIQSIGKITVPSPGTPVPITAGQVGTPGRFACHGVIIQALPTNVGPIYLGTARMQKSTFTEVYLVLAIPTPTHIPVFTGGRSNVSAGINLVDFYVDADAEYDGVLVTVLRD